LMSSLVRILSRVLRIIRRESLSFDRFPGADYDK
jgi:hypothetical protein